MTAEEQRIIGGLQVAVENLQASHEEGRQEHREDMRRLFERIESMQRDGCAMGQRHNARLDGIERRAALIGGGIAAGVAAVIAAVLRWVRMP